jgi:hypothetical protein
MMTLRRYMTVIFLIFFGTIPVSSQDKFFITTNKASYTLPFDFVNNMMVIPIEVNGKELSFLLDTGIENSIIFNFKFKDSLILKDTEEIKLHGLGEGESLNALRSRNNLIRIGKILNLNHMIYVVLDEKFDLSAKMGIDINGIIGGDLFKDFIVDVNYQNKKLTFYDPKRYTADNCKKCQTFPLEFFRNKPYISAKVINEEGDLSRVKLLIDSGGGDALWLFEGSEEHIKITGRSFDDYLGQGLSGEIFGKRAMISKMILGDFVFENITVSYPDSSSVFTAQMNKDRNGTLGAEILRRFHMIIDYPHKQITLKRTRDFGDPFLYNKSGLELVYGGKMLVREEKSFIVPNQNTANSSRSSYPEVIYTYALSYKPSYRISFVREGSPAQLAGLQVDDYVVEINGKPVYNKSLQDIINELSGMKSKKIKLRIRRNDQYLRFKFVLKEIL